MNEEKIKSSVLRLYKRDELLHLVILVKPTLDLTSNQEYCFSLAEHKIEVWRMKKLSKNLYWFDLVISEEELETLESRLVIKFQTKVGNETEDYDLQYSFFARKMMRYIKMPFTTYTDRKRNLLRVVYLNQQGILLFGTRPSTKTGYMQEIKLMLAYIIAKFLPKKNIVLMYEKQCERFEESGWHVFKRLIDDGHKNVYYCLTKRSAGYENIEIKYQKHIIEPGTFKHNLYFLKAEKFCGTEVMTHLVNRSIKGVVVGKKICHPKTTAIILRHGVTSLSQTSEFRKSYYRKGSNLPYNVKVVVSSQLEAEDFLATNDFEKDDLLITGMPKFDISYKNPDADKIVIMPTWRSWEMVQASQRLENTGYYRLMMAMLEAVPEELRCKVILLPHPLVLQYFQQQNLFSEYLVKTGSYDEILRDCELLITDYSSIAYDAFYRGAKTIFYWADKKECMEKYGGDLILSEQKIFGDICYTPAKLQQAIIMNYNSKQKKEHQEKFKLFVEFADNRNTERVLSAMNNLHFLS